LRDADSIHRTASLCERSGVADDGVDPSSTQRSAHVKTEQLLEEIREANLSYLILAQHLIRKDKAEALFRLGVSEEVADIIERLSTAQILKIAASNMLMCRFRFDDEIVWGLLTNHGRERGVAGAHAAILMADALPEAA
jgi:flagellar transcriptional activator FlhD